MSTRIIGFAGKKRTGKNTAAERAVNYGYKELSFAYPLKKGVQAMFGFTDEQMDEKKEVIDDYWGITPRRALQVQGTDIVRELYPDLMFGKDNIQSFWILNIEKKIRELEKKHAAMYEKEQKNPEVPLCIVISDVRFEDEKAYIQSRGGEVVVIKRPSVEEKNASDTHVSEQMKGFDDCKVIYNDSNLESFLKKIDKYIMTC